MFLSDHGVTELETNSIQISDGYTNPQRLNILSLSDEWVRGLERRWKIPGIRWKWKQHSRTPGHTESSPRRETYIAPESTVKIRKGTYKWRNDAAQKLGETRTNWNLVFGKMLEDPSLRLCGHSHCTSGKSAKTHTWEKTTFSTNGTGKTRYLHTVGWSHTRM